MGFGYRHAIVRPPGEGYARCIRPPGDDGAIDVSRARAQHNDYVSVIASHGFEIIRLESDERFPDGCFVEDTAVVAPGRAAICSSAQASRRGEADAVADVLGRYLAIFAISPPAMIDGGDVLRMGDTLFVGISQRTNAAAVMSLREIVAPAGFTVVTVEMRGILHLKSGCSRAGDDAVLICPEHVDQSAFSGFRQIVVPPEELYAANCLALDEVVVVSDGYPRTRESLEEFGFETISLEMSEFRKGWGSLTCLSVLF